MWVCNRNLYRTKDGKMVEEGDHRAHVLLFSRGDHLASEPVVLKLEKKARKPVEDKAIRPSTTPKSGSAQDADEVENK